MILALPINIPIEVETPTYEFRKEIHINEEFFKGKSITGYPYMTTDFPSIIKLNRDDYYQLESYLRANVSKRYDFISKKYVPCNGMMKDNKQCFIIGGLAFQFFDHHLYIGFEPMVKVGNFF